MTQKHFSIEGNLEHFTIADIVKGNPHFRKTLWTGATPMINRWCYTRSTLHRNMPLTPSIRPKTKPTPPKHPDKTPHHWPKHNVA